VISTRPPEVAASHRRHAIAYVTTTFPTIAWFLENEVLKLLDRGVDVRVFTLRGVGKAVHPEHSRLIAISRAIGSPLDPRSWFALLRWTIARPNVLIPEALHLVWASRRSAYALAGHIGYLPAAARLADLVRAGGIDRIHGAWAHFPATVAYLASRLTELPFSMTGHAGTDLYRTQAFLDRKVAAATFVTTSVGENAEMLRRLAPGARVECIYHGVDLERFRDVRRAPEATPLLAAVGRLTGQKGFDLAIRAVAELARRGHAVRLQIIGEGPDRASLEALAASLGVADRVELIGNRSHQDVLALYARAWMLVAPSRILAQGLRDGIPNVVVEALASGLPVVGARLVGIPEAVADGENGVLCEPENAIALADAIEPLLQDPERLSRMSRQAAESVRERFDSRRSVERLRELLEVGGG
jgi:glycosyltransferase involved in cell wall biosynthesis